MTPIDAGPLVALIDPADAYHSHCKAKGLTLPAPFITTLPCLTEALYLLGRGGGFVAQRSLLEYRASGRLVVYPLTNSDLDRAALLMATYSDLPCDFADATLIVAAEQLEATRIFTLDRHFYAYRPLRGAAFEIFPGPLPR